MIYRAHWKLYIYVMRGLSRIKTSFIEIVFDIVPTPGIEKTFVDGKSDILINKRVLFTNGRAWKCGKALYL